MKPEQMRKVKFNKFVRGSVAPNGGGVSSAYWQDDFPNDAVFHQWINAHESASAVVELPDGSIRIVPYHAIKFVDAPSPH